ncbi:MAG: class I SAM-dependent methyltransferase [Phycisphaerae bacterium]|nr:class I SAM-dependent methyltransferase [Phycisphaerae bacterium]
MDRNDISAYWDAKAEALKTDPSATMKDVILRSLEIEAIGRRLRETDDLLDVGGGNAFAGIQWAKHCRSVRVVDFSEKMVAYGREAVAEAGLTNVQTERGSVLELETFAGQYSAVSCIRVLINLPDREDQLRGVDQLASCVAPGGRLFLIEGLEETFTAMNAMRETMNLPAIPLDWHNTLLPKEALEQRLERELKIDERVDFGEYYYLSRVLHPLLVAPDEPTFQGRCNQEARRLWQAGTARGRFADISTLVLYVCSRPE